MLNKIRFLKEKFLEVEKEMMKPEVIADNKKYAELCKEYNELEPISLAYDEYSQLLSTIESDTELLETETDNEMRSLLNTELEECKVKREELDEKIKILLLPKDENDDRNVILEIRSGAGGEEASLFGGVLLRMYTMYAESKHWKVETLSISETELGGIKEALVRELIVSLNTSLVFIECREFQRQRAVVEFILVHQLLPYFQNTKKWMLKLMKKIFR